MLCGSCLLALTNLSEFCVAITTTNIYCYVVTLIILRDYKYSHLKSTYNFNLHDRAGTFASLLYKAEKPSVCLDCPVDISAVSASIEMKLAQNES